MVASPVAMAIDKAGEEEGEEGADSDAVVVTDKGSTGLLT